MLCLEDKMKIDFKKVLKGPKGKNLEVETGEKKENGEPVLRPMTLEDVIVPMLYIPTEMNQKAALDVKRRLYKLYLQIESSEDKVLDIPKDLLNIVLERVTDEKSGWGLLVQMQVDEIFNADEIVELKVT